MKNFLNIRNPLILLLSLSIIIMSTSCETEPVEDRPDLPPLESFKMDFSDFDEQPAEAKGSVLSYENFLHSFANVVFWNGITTVTLILPVTAYAYAFNQTPEYQGDYTWVWSYDFKLNNVDYTATLTGERLNNEEFSMEMVIALKLFPNQGVKWFDGVCRYDHTHASWNLYKNSEGTPVRILEVDWNMDYVTEEGDITYTYVESGHNESGSYIKYEMFPADPVEIDAAYTISLSGGMVNIEWNRTTKAGRVKNPVYFEDEAWHCWDETLADVSCE